MGVDAALRAGDHDVNHFTAVTDLAFRADLFGDAFDRYQLLADGTVKTGNGTVAPTATTAQSQTVSGARTFTGGVTLTTAGLTLTDVNVVLSATTGTKFGTATSQKLGFFNAAPVAQQVSAPAGSDAGTTQTLANALRTALLNLGLIA